MKQIKHEILFGDNISFDDVYQTMRFCGMRFYGIMRFGLSRSMETDQSKQNDRTINLKEGVLNVKLVGLRVLRNEGARRRAQPLPLEVPPEHDKHPSDVNDRELFVQLLCVGVVVHRLLRCLPSATSHSSITPWRRLLTVVYCDHLDMQSAK